MVERCTSNVSESYVEVKEEVADYNNPEFQRMQQVVANNFPATQFCVYPSDATYPLCYIPTNKTIENTNSNCSVNQQSLSVESSSNTSHFSSERNQTNESVSIYEPIQIQQDSGRIILTPERLKREFLLYQAEGFDTFYWYLKLGKNVPYLTFEKSDSLTNFVLIVVTKNLEVKILPCNNSLNHSHELRLPKWRTISSLKDLLRIMKYVNIWKVCEGVQDEVVMRYTDSLKCLYFCTNSHALRSRKCSLLFPKVKYDNCDSCNTIQKLIIGTVRKYKKQANLLEELAKLEDLEMTLEDGAI